MSKQFDTGVEGRRDHARLTRRGFIGGLFMGALLSALLTVTVGAFAQQDGSGRPDFLASEAFPVAIELYMRQFDSPLDAVDATEEQREEVKSILRGAGADLMTWVRAYVSTREALVETLRQPSVDRVALEQLRTTALQHADDTSQVAVQVLADVAEVLTPEQRQRLDLFPDNEEEHQH